MTKNQIEIGGVYIVKVSGKMARVRIDSVSQYGGWIGTNLATGREIRMKTAGKMRREVSAPSEKKPIENGQPVTYPVTYGSWRLK